MGKIGSPQPVKLIASLIFGDHGSFSLTVKGMVSLWGPLDFMSELMPFDYTSYYAEEMGTHLCRRIVSFEPLINPQGLWHIKHLTNNLEEKHSPVPQRRAVNIDPGYIGLHHFILATTKSCTHRPYLQEGIYADLTLIYLGKSFRPLPWTYPDYQSQTVIEIMNLLRQKCLLQLKAGGHLEPHHAES